jgi:Family of unknown function (DUF6600)
MGTRRILAALLVVAMLAPGLGGVAGAQAPVPPPPPAPAANAPESPQPGAPTPAAPAPAPDVTPVRISYLNGEVSFWRPGGTEWAPARLNTPLAPGDVLYTGEGGTVELQLGPRAFVRAAPGTHIGFDNQEPDFLQLRVTAGHAALDVRELAVGHTVEIATPGGAFTVEKTGYYPVDVTAEATTFHAHRGGQAVVTPAGGSATPLASNQQVKLIGAEAPRIETAAAPELSAWDRWNYQRTDYMVKPVSTQYVGTAVYGGEELDRYGSWRTVDTYGSVWVPSGLAPGWVPYSTGRWIWDPRFGWTWLDDAPWGWAPYHHGRWVFVNSYWAWAPGPVVVRPVYAPALVVFLGGVTLGFGRPVCWAPLAWGEPLIPWWGRPGFVGVATWRGWGGPRVVNNVVVRNTTVNVTNINVYRNVTVNNAVVATSSDRFGRGQVQAQRVSATQARELQPVRGTLDVRPVAASVAPASGQAARPPASVETRTVVATRAPRDVAPALQSQGLSAGTPATTPAPAPRIVPAPRQSVRRDADDNGRGRGTPPAQPRVVTPAQPGSTTPQPSAPTPAQPRVGTPDGARPDSAPRTDSPRRERDREGRQNVERAPSPAPGGSAPATTAPRVGTPATPPAPSTPAPAPGAPRTVTPSPAPPASGAPRTVTPSPAPPASGAPASAPTAPRPAMPAPPPPPPANAPGAATPREREQERPDPRGSAQPQRPPVAPAPTIQQAPPAPPRLDPRSERPARIEPPRARVEAPRQERGPERIEERAPRPEPRFERGAPDRGAPDRGGPDRDTPGRGQGRGDREQGRG